MLLSLCFLWFFPHQPSYLELVFICTGVDLSGSFGCWTDIAVVDPDAGFWTFEFWHSKYFKVCDDTVWSCHFYNFYFFFCTIFINGFRDQPLMLCNTSCVAVEYNLSEDTDIEGVYCLTTSSLCVRNIMYGFIYWTVLDIGNRGSAPVLFFEPTSGTLAAGASLSVRVTYRPRCCERLRTRVEVKVKYGETQWVAVRGEVQVCMDMLDTSHYPTLCIVHVFRLLKLCFDNIHLISAPHMLVCTGCPFIYLEIQRTET